MIVMVVVVSVVEGMIIVSVVWVVIEVVPMVAVSMSVYVYER